MRAAGGLGRTTAGAMVPKRVPAKRVPDTNLASTLQANPGFLRYSVKLCKET